ncbi:putative HTH-type transcriptional regulator YxaD [Jeotgalicoccus coquinae]|uniref:DNA-binding MarR family transcriptional regulator n=1 Tax=Jeotgalicoccus coquinae TaxID=709509 RepID=A0A6V7RTQ8_9STAP|nr:MarR family transcriptional regulator [Jeotgalicoccus coquinae]MBB6423333.1 DNA-binding MarR family transcriptional regulator [Jeotgalicoccus coquinae]GGE08882.1 putative HTH-type transcriptional regulator YxaD [Jeotgalicoccus coquinae]CAD2081719.1 MarR family protein [Jeotgalicoccus coquinae]
MINDESLETLELELAMMVRALRTRSVELNKKQELKRASYLILLLITKNGPMSVKQISEKLHLDISTVSRQAADLLADHMLYKKPSETDRRSYLYAINDKGLDMMKYIRHSRQQRFSKMIDEWDQTEIDEFAHLLKKFNSLMN